MSTLVGDYEWMHGVGFGALDDHEEEGDGAREGAVRRAQPETAAPFDADDPDAGAPAEDAPGELAADEGGDGA